VIPDQIIEEFRNLAEKANGPRGRVDWPMLKLLEIIRVQDAEIDALRERVEVLESKVG
jgi:hypothetical protein